MLEKRISALRSELKVPIESVSWEMLPPGELGKQRFLDLLRSIRHAKRDEIISRFDFALSLEPKRIFVGKGGFEGYAAFLFDWTCFVLMDRIDYGNAAYVFRKRWKELSAKTKAEVRQMRNSSVQRIVHKSSHQWQMDILDALKQGEPL